MMITFVHGAGSSGNAHAELLRMRFRAKRIVDGWSPTDDRQLLDGDLVLTDGPPHSFQAPAGSIRVRVFTIVDALRLIGR
jgi:hypothetical protein